MAHASTRTESLERHTKPHVQERISEASAALKDHLRRLPSMRGRDRGLGHRDASIMGKQLKAMREQMTADVGHAGSPLQPCCAHLLK